MPEVICTTVYQFPELSDAAKEKARSWYRELGPHDDWWDAVYEDFERVCEILGIRLKTTPVRLMGGGTRAKPCIWFSGFWSQGDGASFEGYWSHAKGAAARIWDYAPTDAALHSIADRLQAIQRRNFYQLHATVMHRVRYYHEYSMAISVERDGPTWQGMTADAEETDFEKIDRHGNAFSATPSDGSDKTPIIPGVGILCSGRGTQSWADPSHPSSVAPGKRPRLTPNPALALKNGHAYMPFGTPGGDVQIQAMIQVFLNINVFGMAVQDAVEAPRFASYSYPGSFEPHAYFPGRLYLESRIDKTTGDALAAMGHKIYWWDDMTWLAGSVCTIVNDFKQGVLHGGADPRRPAYVLGW